MSVTIIVAKKNATNARTSGIQSGDVTHIQDQVITPVSFSIVKIINNRSVIFVLVLIFFDLDIGYPLNGGRGN